MHRTVRTIHLSLALATGLFLSILGISGSLLVLHAPMMRAEYGAHLTDLATDVPPGTDPVQWVRAAKANYPQLGEPFEVAAPGAVFRIDTALVFYFVHHGPYHGFIAVSIDPATNRVRGTMPMGRDNWSMLPRFVHESLLLPTGAETIVGLIALAGLSSLLSGLIVWWPKRGLPKALKWRSGLKGRAFWYQLHGLAGVFSVPLSAIVIASGLWLMNPAWVDPVAASISPIRLAAFDDHRLAGLDNCPGGNVTLEQAVALAQKAVPAAAVRFAVRDMDAENGYYHITMARPGDIDGLGGDTAVLVGGKCPKTLFVRAAEGLSVSEAAKQWSLPLHYGHFAGWVGPALVFVSGLLMPLFFLSGLYLYLKRRKPRPAGNDPA